MLFILLAVILGGQVAAIVIITIVVPGFVAIPSPLPPHIPLGACVVLGADHRFPYYLYVGQAPLTDAPLTSFLQITDRRCRDNSVALYYGQVHS